MPSKKRPWLLALKTLGVTASIASLLVIYLPDLPVFGRFFYPFRYRTLIEQQARHYGLDPLFVAAVIRQESGFRASARSHVGARGLMQLMPQTAAWASQKAGLKNFSVARLDDPATNIALGCWYLHYLFGQFHDPALVLAAYNGGEGNLAYWGSLQGEHLAHAFPETQTYVESGLRTYSRYQTLYGGEVARVLPHRLKLEH
ncbi:MAG TPA: lytic transglycosylase domain-containing protein [Oscillatoriaceae cyanobacterium]